MKRKIGNLHEEEIKFLVLEGPTVDIILGRPWLILHSPEIKWESSENLLERILPPTLSQGNSTSSSQVTRSSGRFHAG